MSDKHKAILKAGNAAIAEGNHEGFLKYCSEDTTWTFIGDITLEGKEAIRQWMAKNYIYPPKVIVKDLISEGNLLIATGEITLADKEGTLNTSSYCDIWRFRGDEMVELRAFVI